MNDLKRRRKDMKYFRTMQNKVLFFLNMKKVFIFLLEMGKKALIGRFLEQFNVGRRSGLISRQWLHHG